MGKLLFLTTWMLSLGVKHPKFENSVNIIHPSRIPPSVGLVSNIHGASRPTRLRSIELRHGKHHAFGRPPLASQEFSIASR